MSIQSHSCGVLLLVVSLSFFSGCREASEPVVAKFEPNLVMAYRYQVDGEYSAKWTDAAIAQSDSALGDLFGTPDEPKLPALVLGDFGDLLSLENLKKAAGPKGLYREHCAKCHGVTGDGRGELAALLNPYPRDYRLGRFKFKSTPIGAKPTREDLATLIRNGIGGTQMVALPKLSDADVEALVDYVIFLTIRGEVERKLLRECSELDLVATEDADVLYDPSMKESEDEDVREYFEEQVELLEDFVLDVVEPWSEAEGSTAEVPARDESVVPGSLIALHEILKADADSPIKQSVARGKELFLGEKAACAKCHGKEGKGDGQTNDYDEWTKDWTKRAGIDPEVEAEHVPFIARGAFPVRKVSPRNFHEGVFRGGGTPEKLYQRIALGIEGTPMPAAAVTPEQIWDIVNYVRSLQEPKTDEPEPATSPSTGDSAGN